MIDGQLELGEVVEKTYYYVPVVMGNPPGAVKRGVEVHNDVPYGVSVRFPSGRNYRYTLPSEGFNANYAMKVARESLAQEVTTTLSDSFDQGKESA